MGYWTDAGSATPEVTTGDFGDRLLTDDGAALTLYYGAPDAEIPKPPRTDSLPAVGAVPDSDSSTPTVGPENTTTTSAPPAPRTRTPPGPSLPRQGSVGVVAPSGSADA